jgi:hypothetical protein
VRLRRDLLIAAEMLFDRRDPLKPAIKSLSGIRKAISTFSLSDCKILVCAESFDWQGSVRNSPASLDFHGT